MFEYYLNRHYSTPHGNDHQHMRAGEITGGINHSYNVAVEAANSGAEEGEIALGKYVFIYLTIPNRTGNVALLRRYRMNM